MISSGYTEDWTRKFIKKVHVKSSRPVRIQANVKHFFRYVLSAKTLTWFAQIVLMLETTFSRAYFCTVKKWNLREIFHVGKPIRKSEYFCVQFVCKEDGLLSPKIYTTEQVH